MSTTIDLPYGHTHLTLNTAGLEVSAVLKTHLDVLERRDNPESMVRKALANPIGTPRLSELARGKARIVIIASDHTRPVPSQILMPRLLEEIRRGAPQASITILIATGLHRQTTHAELESKFGPEIVHHERIVIHDCDDTENLVDLGTLPSGETLWANRLVAEADLVLAEGFIEPHFFAGFSGGRKSILPGVAGRQSVMSNHCSAMIAHPNARTGVIEGNPIHRDMLDAARKAKLAFILNVVVDAHHNPVFAAAGDCEAAHQAGCRFVATHCQAEAVPSDIVVSTNGGYPMDQNIYQAVKGMTAAEATVRDGGVIVMLAEACDGMGGEAFHRTFAENPDVDALMREFLARDARATIVDQWQSQIFARVLQKAKVVFLSSQPDDLVRDMHMIPAHSLEEAIATAKALVGVREPSVAIIPDGVSVIVRGKPSPDDRR